MRVRADACASATNSAVATRAVSESKCFLVSPLSLFAHSRLLQTRGPRRHQVRGIPRKRTAWCEPGTDAGRGKRTCRLHLCNSLTVDREDQPVPPVRLPGGPPMPAMRKQVSPGPGMAASCSWAAPLRPHGGGPDGKRTKHTAQRQEYSPFWRGCAGNPNGPLPVRIARATAFLRQVGRRLRATYLARGAGARFARRIDGWPAFFARSHLRAVETRARTTERIVTPGWLPRSAILRDSSGLAEKTSVD